MSDSSWKHFIERQVVDEDVRREIGHSWLRCYYSGLDAYTSHKAPTLTVDDIERRLVKNKQLLEVCTPFMIELQEVVSETGYLTSLADSDGVILSMICDEKIIDDVIRVNLIRGSVWSEEKAGTNATGLALSLEKPIQVIGEEHYFRCYHHLTCSAAPIFDAEGKIIGVLDMSGPKDKAYPHTLGMVLAASKAITRQLCFEAANRQQNLTNQYLKTIIETINEGVIATDINGKIIGINSRGASILHTTTFDAYGKNVLDIMEGEPLLLDELNEGKTVDNKKMMLDTGTGKVNCLVNSRLIYHDNGDVVGAVSTLKEVGKKEQEKAQHKTGSRDFSFDDLIGEHPSFMRSVHLAKTASRSMSTVLLQGESGTGKELFAKAIHYEHTGGRKAPFIAINCSAIPASLIESELFGYEEGAFTGAKKSGKKGKFELAKGGTLFLDEIGEMPVNLQAHLLRVIQERYVQPVGGKDGVLIDDVKIIVASNKVLSKEVKGGRFREDLYYRLNVLQIGIPPLRERSSDIKLLSEYFIDELSEKLGKEIEYFLPSTLKIMQRYYWHGNIRQLKNSIESAICFTDEPTIDAFYVSDYLSKMDRLGQMNAKEYVVEPDTLGDESIENVEKKMIREALEKFREKKEVAEHLGISRSTLYRKIRKYQLEG
jgi:transcriptional regulator with PAS, ATPase and Fis domain